jgi:LPXTG-motif cell wall-anchored protein
MTMDFLSNPLVLAGMGLALVALIGVMIYMRNKKADDE